MNTAYISGKTLIWARNRARLQPEQIAVRGISASEILDWENGSALPTQKQAEALAARLGVPLALLFMEDPPAADPPKIPDLRTVHGRPLANPTPDFLKVLDSSRLRQEWCRTERVETFSRPLEFVASFNIRNRPKDVAESMRNVLRLDADFRSECVNYEDFLKNFVSTAEASGILVMRSAIVGHSTQRPLSIAEFRGFALSDSIAPIVFINDSDAKAAQIFTLAHELVHIWLGRDGISDQLPTEKIPSHNEIEIFCDQAAAELLVPEAEFLPRWFSDKSDDQNIQYIARFFKVSSLVVLRRALELNKIELITFRSASQAAYDGFRKKESEHLLRGKKAKKKGGNFWASFELRNGARFNATVVTSVREQRTTYTEASGLLGVNLSSTARYIRRVSGG